MNRLSLYPSLSIALMVAACSATPVKPTSLAMQVSTLAGSSARLPALTDPYLDPAWYVDELSVDRAVQATLLNNPETRVPLARLEAGQAERLQAGVIRNPVASLMALRPNGGGRFELDYSLMQSLFDLMTRSRRVAVADAAQQRIEAEVLVQLANLVQSTEAAYYQAVAAQQRTRITEQQLALDQRVLALAERQARQGATSVTASLQQSANVAMREHSLREAKAAEATALATLARQVGLASATALRLPAALPDLTLAGLTAEQAQPLAAAHRPELQGSRAAIEQARAEQSLQSGSLRSTDPMIGPAGNRESDGTKRNGLALQITLPILDSGQARRQLAAANVRQAQFLDEVQRRQIPLQVELALILVATNQMALAHAEHHLLQQERLAILAERTYRQGSGDAGMRIAAQQALLEADLQRLDAQATLADAVVGLHRATGTSMVNENP